MEKRATVSHMSWSIVSEEEHRLLVLILVHTTASVTSSTPHSTRADQEVTDEAIPLSSGNVCVYVCVCVCVCVCASISLSQSSSAVGEMTLASYNTVPFITVVSIQHTASSQPQRAGHSSIPSDTFYQPTSDTGETKQHDVMIMRCDWSVVYLQRCSRHTFTS